MFWERNQVVKLVGNIKNEQILDICDTREQKKCEGVKIQAKEMSLLVEYKKPRLASLSAFHIL